MFNTKDIIAGITVGLLIAGLIVGALYLPKVFSEDNLPPPQEAKFITINEQSFRDWALRLNEENVNYQHTGGFRSQIATFPMTFKNVQIADTEDGKRRVFGQFESFGSDTYEAFGKFESEISQSSAIEIQIELFSGKLSTETTSANRISGKITIVESRQQASIKGALQMGSLNYAGLPFGATNLDFGGVPQGITAQASSQVSGHQGSVIEVTGEFVKGAFQRPSGTLKVASLNNLATTIEAIASGQSTGLPYLLQNMTDLEVAFQLDQRAKLPAGSWKFDLKTDAFGDKFQSIAVLNKPEKKLKLAARMHDFWLKDFPYGLQKVSGDVTTQGIIELSLNQTDDEVYGPFSTKFEKMNLKKEKLEIKNANALIKYSSLNPLVIEDFDIYADSMNLDEPFQNITFSMANGANGIEVKTIKGFWKSAPIELELDFKEDRELPDLYAQREVSNISDLSNILGVDLRFSGPIRFRKSWIFNGLEYESQDLSFKNTAPGILTLNENIPELRNLYINDIELILEDHKTAALNAKGTNPLLYGDKPVMIKTKLQRAVAE